MKKSGPCVGNQGDVTEAAEQDKTHVRKFFCRFGLAIIGPEVVWKRFERSASGHVSRFVSASGHVSRFVWASRMHPPILRIGQRTYASWGPIFWPFLRSPVLRAPTIQAAKGTVAIEGIFDN